MEATNPRRTLTWGVCIAGALVTRANVELWSEDDPIREVVLGWEDLPDSGDAVFRGGPLRATELAAAIKMADPDEVVQVLVWEAED